MNVVAERGHHQAEHLFVLAEHDVRAGGVEGEAIFDDGAAQPADAGAALDDLDVIAEEGSECDAGDAAAEDAQASMGHDSMSHDAIGHARRPRVVGGVL